MQCEPINPSSGWKTHLSNQKQFSYVKYKRESPTKCFLLKYCWRRTRGLATSIHGTHSKATTTRKHWSPFCKRNKSQVIQLQPLLKHTHRTQQEWLNSQNVDTPLPLSLLGTAVKYLMPAAVTSD